MSPTAPVRSLLSLLFATTLLSCGGGDSSDPPAAAPPSIPPLAQPPLDISGTAAPVGIDYWGDNSAVNGGKGTTIDGIPCRVMDETFHIHPHLAGSSSNNLCCGIKIVCIEVLHLLCGNLFDLGLGDSADFDSVWLA